MSAVNKYGAIGILLAERQGSVVTLAWDELDRAVGGLPVSAHVHAPWWHGDRPQTRAWRAAGYVLERVDVGHTVTFREVASRAGGTPIGRKDTPSVGAADRRAAVSVDAAALLADLDPNRTVALIPCSKHKAAASAGAPRAAASDPGPWSPALEHARSAVAGPAHVDERRVLPAWQRYTGFFYRQAQRALAEAASDNAPVLILSGGYGVLELNERIGWYDRPLNRREWPGNLLGQEISDYAHGRGLRTIVAFVAHSSPYAQVIRTTDWAELDVDRVFLVSATAPGGGAQRAVPRTLGAAFSVWRRRTPDAMPTGLRAETVVGT